MSGANEPGAGRALAGMRVLDLSRVFAGPWCTQLLADFGADVIKVEQPGVGDDVRRLGAQAIGPDGLPLDGRSSFLAMNRNKRSLTVDFSSGEGAEIIARLAETSDVLVENFLVGTLARYGLDYATLSARNPRLVYCSITGFGQTGPARHQPGYDAIFQASSGLMSITGPANADEPCLVGYSISDINAGLYASFAIMTALHHRDRQSGVGQHIDIALLDAQIASMAHVVMYDQLSERPTRPSGSASQINCPWQTFSCSDGPLMVTVGNDRQFRKLALALDLPDLADDPRFTVNEHRLLNRAALVAILAPCFSARSVEDAAGLLLAAGVPAAAVCTVAEALKAPHAVARGLKVSIANGPAQGYEGLANPIRLSDSPATYRLQPPRLGEHSAEILKEVLSFSDEHCVLLEQRGII